MHGTPDQGRTPPPAPLMATPPPPPALDPRPSALQSRVLMALFGGGVVLVLLGAALSVPRPLLLQRGGFFLATFALLVGAAWLPSSVLSSRVDALLERWVRNTSGGFYGVMALSVFVQMELAGLLDRITGFELDGSALRNALVEHVIGFSTDTVMSFVWGMAWPARLIQDHGPGASALLAGACWLVFRGSRAVLPHGGFEKKAKPGARTPPRGP